MVQNHLPHDHGQTIEQELEHILLHNPLLLILRKALGNPLPFLLQ